MADKHGLISCFVTFPSSSCSHAVCCAPLSPALANQQSHPHLLVAQAAHSSSIVPPQVIPGGMDSLDDHDLVVTSSPRHGIRDSESSQTPTAGQPQDASSVSQPMADKVQMAVLSDTTGHSCCAAFSLQVVAACPVDPTCPGPAMQPRPHELPCDPPKLRLMLPLCRRRTFPQAMAWPCRQPSSLLATLTQWGHPAARCTLPRQSK